MQAIETPTEAGVAGSRQGWVVKGITAGVAAVLLILAWSMLCSAPGIPWNAVRLSPSFALARGLPIYALRDSGAHLGWVYGPVFPLWFTPAGLTDNPTTGLMLAAAWNIVALVLPIFIALRVALGAAQRAVIWQMTLLGTVLLLANPITNSAFYYMHVDALCVGWALVACAALHARAVRGWAPGLPVAALAVALAVATKQVAVVLLPATILWLWREGHTRLLWPWLFWLATICGGLAVVFFACFGPEELLFNAWLLFSRMPWRGGWGQLGANALEVFQSCWLWWTGAGLGWLVVRARWREHLTAEAGAFARLLGWVALVQAPLGLTASLLVDAALNSIHSTSYLLVAGLVVAGSLLARGNAVANSPLGLRQYLMLGLVAGVGLVTDVKLVIDRGVVWTPFHGQEELLAMVRRTPGKIYLPWNPLVHLIAERKIYPFDEALRYLWLARLEPPRAAIRAAVPEGAFIFYQEPSQSHFALNYFGKDARAPAIDR